MARRQPYAHAIVPEQAATEPEIESDPLKVDGPSLEIVLDDDPVVPASDTPQAKPDPEPEVTVQPEPEPEPVREADDEAFNRLKAQLERERSAREAAQRRAQELETNQYTVQERLRQEQERAQAIRQEHLEAQEAAITNALSYAEAQAAQAQKEITRALNEGDYEASANAYRALAKAESDLARLQEGKQAIEAQRKAPAPQRQEPAQQPYQPQSKWDRIEQYITQPAHSPRAQQFMRDHYDDLFNDFDSGAHRLHKLLGGHYLAKGDGIAENSDEYYKFLNGHMGYEKADPAPQPKAEAQTPPPAPAKPAAKQVPPAAPVSRSGPNGGGSGTSVTLTPAQVAFCRETGIDPRAYARELLRAQQGGKDPNYRGSRLSSDLW